MPKRWISLRARRDSPDQELEIGQPYNFNFMFATPEPPKAVEHFPRTSSLAYRPEPERPQTSSGLTDTLPPLRFHIGTGSRPQTSDGLKSPQLRTFYSPPTPKFNMTPKNDMIGLAFGSPTHPPTNFYGMIDSITPVELGNHAFEQYGPFPDGQDRRRKRKWNISTLFRPKGTQKVSEPFDKVKLENDRFPAVSEPTSRKRSSSRSRAKVPRDDDASASSPPQPQLQDEPQIQSPDHTEEGTFVIPRVPLPKLQVEIPSAKMDRYTVLFSKLDREQFPSSLLSRREKSLEKLTPTDSVEVSTASTMPTESEKPFSRRPRSSSGPRIAIPVTPSTPIVAPKATGNFSLFPNTSTVSLKTTRINLPSQSPLKRAVTSPARMSPAQENFTFHVEKPPPLKVNKANESQLASPEESTASTTQTNTPWSAGTEESTKSSVTTIDDDILFDVKSFRDSNGLAAQFEIARPTSTAVALYRSMSHNLKARAPRPSLSATINTRDSIAVAGEFQAIDETIAAVVKMTRRGPLTPPSSPPRKSVPSGLIKSTSPQGSPQRTILVNTRVESPSPAMSPQRPHVAQLLEGSPHPKSSLDLPEPVPIPVIQVDSPTIPHLNPDVPPPVPAKDTKFVPVSKFARKAGERGSKPRRSFTDPAMPTIQGSPRDQQQTFKPRSNTADSPGSSRAPHAKAKPVIHQSSRPGHPTSRREKPAVTTVTAIVQPASEVSVARTVSLSRKVSQRVLVTTRKGDVKAGDDLKEERETEEKRKTRIELLETRAVNLAMVEGLPGHRVGKSVHALIEST